MSMISSQANVIRRSGVGSGNSYDRYAKSVRKKSLSASKHSIRKISTDQDPNQIVNLNVKKENLTYIQRFKNVTTSIIKSVINKDDYDEGEFIFLNLLFLLNLVIEVLWNI
jgi:hypothetical protein